MNTSVGWTFTSFQEEAPQLHEKMKCMIYQREKCPKTGKLHWQGACRFNRRNGVAFSTAKKCLPLYAHIEPSRGTWQQNVEYCSKSESRIGDPVFLGLPPSFGEDLIEKKLCKLRPLVDMAMQGESMKRVCLQDPSTYARNYRALAQISKMFCDKPYTHELLEEDFIIPLQDFEDKAIVIVGPTKLGKTHYALAHFENPLVISHIDDLAKFDNSEHDGIVFDDMSFAHFPRTAQIHLTDWDLPRSINIKHGTATIPANTRKIFTCNEYPFSYDDAIERRVKRIDVIEHLVKNPKD